MAARFRPTAVPERTVNPYKLRQLDKQGDLLCENVVAADSCNAALRELKDVVDEAQRIVVFNDKGEKAGEINVDYWLRRRRR